MYNIHVSHSILLMWLPAGTLGCNEYVQLCTVVIIQIVWWHRGFWRSTANIWPPPSMTGPTCRYLVGSRRMEIWAITLVRHHSRKLSTLVRLSKLMSSSTSILVSDGLICTHFSSLHVLLSRYPVHGTLSAGSDGPKPTQKFAECTVAPWTAPSTQITKHYLIQ